jgi:hypothetical protein
VRRHDQTPYSFSYSNIPTETFSNYTKLEKGLRAGMTWMRQILYSFFNSTQEFFSIRAQARPFSALFHSIFYSKITTVTNRNTFTLFVIVRARRYEKIIPLRLPGSS